MELLRELFERLHHHLKRKRGTHGAHGHTAAETDPFATNRRDTGLPASLGSPCASSSPSAPLTLRESGLFASLRVEPLTLANNHATLERLRLPGQRTIDLADVLRICCVFGQVQHDPAQVFCSRASVFCRVMWRSRCRASPSCLSHASVGC